MRRHDPVPLPGQTNVNDPNEPVYPLVHSPYPHLHAVLGTHGVVHAQGPVAPDAPTTSSYGQRNSSIDFLRRPRSDFFSVAVSKTDSAPSRSSTGLWSHHRASKATRGAGPPEEAGDIVPLVGSDALFYRDTFFPLRNTVPPRNEPDGLSAWSRGGALSDRDGILPGTRSLRESV